MKFQNKNVVTRIRLIVISIVISLGIALPVQRAITPQVEAATIDELQKKSQSLQAEIEANNAKVKDLSQLADSLQVKVQELQAEIARASAEIELTEVKLEELKERLKIAEAELERQKELLKATLQAIYERTGASTFELLMATDSFTDFVNEQEYLGQLQSAVKQSTEKVIKLKQQIEAEKLTQEQLLKKQIEQKRLVDAKRAEQQQLLDSTQGEESRYRTIVKSQLDQLKAAEDELVAKLAAQAAAGAYINYGPVSREQIIGSVGSTGFSDGPHVHFMTKQNGNSINPWNGGRSLINGYAWPVSGSSYVSTPFGYNLPCNGAYGSYPTCSGPNDTYTHTGLDIAAPYFSPVLAAEAGNVIFKGCSGGLGYVVVIDHGGGWQTWYPHMITPGGQVSRYCG